MPWLDACLVAAAVGVAASLRPWRAVAPHGPPWPWLACMAVMPLMWRVDQMAHSTLVQPFSGACLLLLMAGWPLAVLGLALVAVATAWLGHLPAAEALHRLAWLGIVPVTLAMALGAAVRRWLPRHLIVYILGRAFFATLLAGSLAGAAPLALRAAPPGVSDGDLLLARMLTAWGEAIVTGMLTAIFVAYRPRWLATYADRLYLPRGPER